MDWIRTKLDEKPPDGFSWSGERLTEKQTTSRPDYMWRDTWKDISEAAQRNAKQHWAVKNKKKLDDAGRLPGIYFVDPEDAEFKETTKNARRKLEVPMPAVMLCKIRRREHKETYCTPDAPKTKYACIVEADESTSKNGKNSRTSWHGSRRKSVTKKKFGAARKEGKTVHFASLVDICYLKNSELEPNFQKYKGRIVFRGDIVKDDSGSYALFTEQGSFASQMTAAKVMDVIARQPGCAGQAADAVSTYTQVNMEDAPSSLKIPMSECPDSWIRLPKNTSGQNHGPAWKIQCSS